jgi:DNA-binding response OmpR family regulator
MKHILVVDDDPGIQEAFTVVFDPEYYDVTIYSTGEPVLNNEVELPDLFILDKQLSGVDGLDICQFLKKQESTRHIPVIMISASPSIYRLSQLAGADYAFEKPFKLKELRQVVNRFLNYSP